MTTAAEIHAEAVARRSESVKGPLGPLALVGTQVIDSPQPVWGVAGTWAPMPDGSSGLLLTAAAADGIEVDGALVDGTVVVAGPDSVTPSSLRFDDARIGTLVAAGGGSTALRVWDSKADAIASFDRIDAFPYAPEWVAAGRLVPLGDDARVTVPHSSAGERTHLTPAAIRVDVAGASLELLAFPDGDRLQVVFADATNGDSTYSVGRFLFLEPDEDGSVVVDFNSAQLPPCAFSYHFNCPIPPAQNRLAVAVTAGEKIALDTDGDPLHY